MHQDTPPAPDGDDTAYCAPAAPRPEPATADEAGAPYADCVRCGKPTEYPASRPGATLCPVCEWQDDQRGACSG
ncbi:hypothetical protein [Yinghuangia seranimata]|uniref:hypothetical protein n=1 Tax=Yinghuangia seranimata TaxID=408067 RepID=UPI00248C5613|nr:hypothetical protein [Yinghuangia seranimata]MDI2129054.1 hypothetical protein [Yinghuangia seranimata]